MNLVFGATSHRRPWAQLWTWYRDAVRRIFAENLRKNCVWLHLKKKTGRQAPPGRAERMFYNLIAVCHVFSSFLFSVFCFVSCIFFPLLFYGFSIVSNLSMVFTFFPVLKFKWFDRLCLVISPSWWVTGVKLYETSRDLQKQMREHLQ